MSDTEQASQRIAGWHAYGNIYKAWMALDNIIGKNAYRFSSDEWHDLSEAHKHMDNLYHKLKTRLEQQFGIEDM